MKSRNSNIESLRLLCMVMIISMHIFGLYNDHLGTAGLAALSFNNAVCNMGVSVFMLISGYYGIQYKPAKLLSLMNIALFWSVVLLIFDVDHTAKNVVKSVFPVFTAKYWFLTAYIVIAFLAPYIDKIVSLITQRQFLMLITILCIFFVLSPSFLMLEIMHDSGKGVINMLLVYLIGRYMAIYGIPRCLTGLSGGYIAADNCNNYWSRFHSYLSFENTVSNVSSRQQYLYPSRSHDAILNGDEYETHHSRFGQRIGILCISNIYKSWGSITSTSLHSRGHEQRAVPDGMVQCNNNNYYCDDARVCKKKTAEFPVRSASEEGIEGDGAWKEETLPERDIKKRLDWLDIAKGLGIIAVVLSHSQCSSLIWIVSACYVPVFFVCSGYTLRRKQDQSFKMFVKQKTRRLLLPYVLGMILILAFNFLAGMVLHQPFDVFRSTIGALYSRAELFPDGTDNNIMMLPMNSQPMWFLTALLISLVSTWPLLRWRDKRSSAFMVALLLFTAYLFSLLPILLPWSIDCMPVFVIMILFGSFVRNHEWMKLPWWHYFVMLIVYILLLCFNDSFNISIREYGISISVTVLSALLGSLLLMKCSLLLEKSVILKISLVKLGQHSLYIMCFHLPVLTVCNKVISGFNFSEGLLFLLYLTSVFFAIIISYVLSVTVQKYIPLR